MNRRANWTPHQLAAIDDCVEVDIATVRVDGSVRNPVPIWVVRVGEELFIRSYRGPTAGWFRQAASAGEAQITAAGNTFAVGLLRDETSPAGLIDQAYTAKYGHSPYLAAMLAPAAVTTTLRLDPVAPTRESS